MLSLTFIICRTSGTSETGGAAGPKAKDLSFRSRLDVEVQLLNLAFRVRLSHLPPYHKYPRAKNVDPST